MSILESFLAGKEARRVADAAEQINAMNAFIGQNGAALMGGDRNAMAQLAGFGPQGLQMAMGMQGDLQAQERQAKMDAMAMEDRAYGRERDKISDQREDQQWEMQMAEYKKGLSAEEAAAEAAQLEEAAKMALTATSPEQWDQLAQENGAPELVGQFENREAVAARFMSMAEVLKSQEAEKPDLTTSQKDYKFYEAQEIAAGRTPLSFNDWDLQSRKASATNVTTTVGGATPEATAAFNKGVKSDNVNEVISDIEATMAGATLPTSGLGGSLLASVPGTAAGDIAANLNTLKAAASFSSLQAMRDASKTGAALGAVSDTEIKLLGAELASLEQSQSPEQFARNLKRFQKVYNEIVNGPDGASDDATGTPLEGMVEDGYRFKGGDPADPANWEQVDG